MADQNAPPPDDQSGTQPPVPDDHDGFGDKTVFGSVGGAGMGHAAALPDMADGPDMTGMTDGPALPDMTDSPALPGGADYDDEPRGFGPTFDPSPDPTLITRDSDAPPAPPEQRTVIGAAAAPIHSAPPAAPRYGPPKLVEPGTLINNNYRIEALISAGGMGEVYRAVNVYTGDPVAVKVVLPDLARDQGIIDLFRREARVLVQLRDDAIVSYHNFVLDQGLQRYCLIMEFVSGAHLGSMLRQDAGLADEPAIALMRRLAQGLGQAHARGVTHRDLSPDNVILRHDRVEEAVLIDFGIARSTELGDGLAGRFAGKFKYIAPEQLGHYDGVVGPQTDIYGLALLMAATLRGKPLEMGDSVVSASDARRQIPDLSGLSHRLFPLLQYMLEPDPANRPASMGQIVAMLDDPMRIPARYRLPLWSGQNAAPSPDGHTTGISETPFGLPLAAPQIAAPGPEAGRARRLPLILAALAAVLATGGGALWFMSQDGAAPRPADPPPGETEVAATLPPRDPASRDGFLAELPLGSCAMATRITSGAGSGMIEVYAATPVDAAQVQDAYHGAFGTRPAVTPRAVAQAQCPVVDFAAALAGRTAPPPEIASAAHATPTGFQIEAGITGLSGRNLWLALIAPDGSVYDLTAQSSAGADGRVTAGASVDVPDAGAPGAAPYLLLAVTSSQPLVAVAAAPAGAPAATLLPAVLEVLQADGAAAAASLSVLAPQQPPEALPAP